MKVICALLVAWVLSHAMVAAYNGRFASSRWRWGSLHAAGKGFGKVSKATKPKEMEMIEDIRATLVERPREEALHFNLGLLLLSGSAAGARAM